MIVTSGNMMRNLQNNNDDKNVWKMLLIIGLIGVTITLISYLKYHQ